MLVCFGLPNRLLTSSESLLIAAATRIVWVSRHFWTTCSPCFQRRIVGNVVRMMTIPSSIRWFHEQMQHNTFTHPLWWSESLVEPWKEIRYIYRKIRGARFILSWGTRDRFWRIVFKEVQKNFLHHHRDGGLDDDEHLSGHLLLFILFFRLFFHLDVVTQTHSRWHSRATILQIFTTIFIYDK